MSMLSIVIPAYNEENGIQNIMTRVLKVQDSLRSINVTMELLVVNDGSRDRTYDFAMEIARRDPCVRVISHPKNRGYGAALKTGFASAKGDLIGFLDADGTYPPESFPELCQAAANGGDLVIGSRMMGAESHMPITRRIGNLFFAGLLSMVGAQRVTDSASGMRVFKRTILERIFPLPDGLNLTPVMSTRALHENLKIVEVPIKYSERVGRSKLSVVRDGRIFLESILWTAMSYNPVRILGLIGLALFILAAAAIVGIVITRASGVTVLGKWGVAALFTALVNAVVGISIFSLGVIFNYLVSLFYQTPIRQGLFGRPMLKTPLENSFGWIGAASFVGGLILSIVTLALGINGWDMNRLWMYLVGSAMAILIGIQLGTNWIIVKVLNELSKRDDKAAQDLNLAAK